MTTQTPGCGPSSPAALAGKPALADRPLLSPGQAGQLVAVFKVLGNDTRLRLLHALHREGEVAVGALAERLGMRTQAISNQLQRLADRGVVTARRDGNRIFYAIADPCIPALLDLGLCLTEETTIAAGDAGGDAARPADEPVGAGAGDERR